MFLNAYKKVKMLPELVKFSSQHRAIYCFLIMSVWIFLIIAGMYKYIVMEEGISPPRQLSLKGDSSKGESRFKKLVKKYCNPAEDIHLGAEGIADESWALQGVLIVIRHGDRGPLTHVRNVEAADCNIRGTSHLLHRFQEYVNNMTALGKAPWSQSPGPFHNIPLLPTTPLSECRLGQLTPRGLLQLLTLGNSLGHIYTSQLGWDFYGNKSETDTGLPQSSGNTKDKYLEMVKNTKISPQNSPVNNQMTIPIMNKPVEGDIIVHSTRYRRAFQSALAFMWSVLGATGPTALSISQAKESPSLTFCAEDCACPAAEYYARKVSLEAKKRLTTHANVMELVEKLSSIVFQSPSQVAKDPHIVEDALLTYMCHSAPLPCVHKPAQDLHGNTKKPAQDLHGNPKKSNDNKESSINEKSLTGRKLNAVDSQKKKPVLDFDSQMEKEKLGYYQQKMIENGDVNYEDVILIKRNLDGDFNFNGDNVNNPGIEGPEIEDYDNKDDITPDKKIDHQELLCVKKEEVMNLFSYIDWELNLVVKSLNFNKASVLRAYGMLHQIVKYVLNIISKGQPKFVLFSGHDKTLQYLSLALGLSDDNVLNMHYASRIAIEIYKNEDKEYLRNRKNSGNHKPKLVAPLDFFLRVIFNGKDVTRQVSFCRGNRSILANKLMKPHNPGAKDEGKAYLCRIENIIRFAHEDYFSIFNSTNFKDSCSIH